MSASLLKQSLAAIEKLQARLDAAEARQREPIAMIGAACRYPGEANDPEALWRLARDGINAIGPATAGRGDTLDRTSQGGFLSKLDQFDPVFFGISPREAHAIDPQQRLLLETSYEAMERAGLAIDGLAGSATGVFIGITLTDYAQLQIADGGNTDPYVANGGALSTAAGRISFVFGFEGPSIALDTACSSSLVAVHLAVQSLRAGETDMALAGGVNVILRPILTTLLSRMGLMAPDAACKPFDAAADGFVRSEGCGIIVLKRLSDAQAAGDPILAVIRGSAVNSDGRSSGLTVPRGPAQEAVIRSALRNAGLRPDEIDYVEAHGTGTALGDPIEMEALANVLAAGRPAERPLLVGALKSNIGHAESAAGIAGLLKTVMALRHEAVPPTLHFHTPSPKIPWADMAVRVPTKLTPWRRGERPRRAGVSGFGFSGTNAHVILEEAPAPEPANTAERPMLIPFSARSASALRDLAQRHADFLATSPAITLADYATTMTEGRSPMPVRLGVIAASLGELAERLRQFAAAAPASPQRHQDDRRQILEPLQALYVSGGNPAWPEAGGRRVALPTYPFQRTRYWMQQAQGHTPAPTQELSGLAVRGQKLAAGAGGALSGLYVLLGGRFARDLAAALRSTGASCLLLEDSNPESLATALAGQPAMVIDCRALAPVTGHVTPAGRSSYLAALSILQTVTDAGARVGLCVLTAGALAVRPDDPIDLARTTLPGLLRAAAAEYPDRLILLGDLDPARPPEPAQAVQLLKSLSLTRPEAAWRAGTLWAPVLSRLSGKAETQSPIRPDGTYLVSGGLGGIGLALAEWLVGRGAGTVLLLGRTAPNERQRAVIENLRAAGGQIVFVLCDVSDAAALRALREGVLRSCPPVRGVLHAAGTLADAPLAVQDAARFETVARGKLDGAWQLHGFTQNDPLDLFVLFSSVSGLFGAAGQANYAAANSFLDGLAAWRRSRGLPALSVAWGAWATRGMAASLAPGQQARMQRHGMRLLAPGPALDAMAATPPGEALVVIAALDWQVLMSQARPGLVALLSGEPASQSATNAILPSPQITPRQVLISEMARVLGYEHAALDLDTPLPDLGFDSMMAIRVRSAVAAQCGRDIPLRLLLQGVPISALLDAIAQETPPGAAIADADMFEEGTL